MLHSHALKSCFSAPLGSQLALLQNCRAYSSRSSSEKEPGDFAEARTWFETFNRSKHTFPNSKTEYSRSSGPGGQKVNKSNSKATTVWPMHTILPQIPKTLHKGLCDSRYYVASSDSIKIQCDSHRGQTQNKNETHERLNQEIASIYLDTVPGATAPGKKEKLDGMKKAENELRLKAKKQHGDKKRSRSGDSWD